MLPYRWWYHFMRGIAARPSVQHLWANKCMKIDVDNHCTAPVVEGVLDLLVS
jgi:hypothetical protein